MRVGVLYGTNVVCASPRGIKSPSGGCKQGVAKVELRYSKAMWCWHKIKHYVAMSDSAAIEEKNITEIRRDPIPTEEFVDVLKARKRKGILAIEFKALGRLQADQYTEEALLAENRYKNTHPEVLPFDHCRVVLDCLPKLCHSDYINASYIDSYSKRKAYIAAQGPSRQTIHDFWRMIWQEHVICIVMATNVFEHARQQCEKYWHNEHGKYGEIDVRLEHSDILADFNIRTFRVKKINCDEERIIKQFQFANWSDHDCPNPTSFIEYRRQIKSFLRNDAGPILVHCGAGAGRTGTYIAIDATLDRAMTEKTVDIFNYVLYLRNSRQNMVKHQQQYEFIYNTVAMNLQCGNTVIPAIDLPAVVQRMARKELHSRLNGFEQQFKILQGVVPKLSVGECAGGHRSENRRKSRDIMIQPPERARPYLVTHDSNDSTDYINAVYADGYRNTNAYIITQWPLRSTINDIWRLVYDYNIPTIVLLNDINGSRNYPRFWPERPGYVYTYGPLTIELESEESNKCVATRVFRIKKPKKYQVLMEDLRKYMEEKMQQNPSHEALLSLQTASSVTEEPAKYIKVFLFKGWPNGSKVPLNVNPMIDLLHMVEDWQINECHGRVPTCVISKNGVSRCGCYCAISTTWDKLRAEGEVDIFRAVKTIKMNRPQLVENLVEYAFCYTFIVELLEILYPDVSPSVSHLQTQETMEEIWDLCDGTGEESPNAHQTRPLTRDPVPSTSGIHNSGIVNKRKPHLSVTPAFCTPPETPDVVREEQSSSPTDNEALAKCNTSLLSASIECSGPTDGQSNDLCLSFASLSDMGDGLSEMEGFSFIGEGLSDICEGLSDMAEDCYLSPTSSVHGQVDVQVHCDSDSGIDTQNVAILRHQASQSPILFGSSPNLADISPNTHGANNNSNPSDNLTVPPVRLRPRKLGLLTPPLSEDIDEEFELWDSPEPDYHRYTVGGTAAEFSNKLDAQPPQEHRQNPRRLPHQPYSEPVVLIENPDNPHSLSNGGVPSHKIRSRSPGCLSERGDSFEHKLDLLDFRLKPKFYSSQDRPMVIPGNEDCKDEMPVCDVGCDHTHCCRATNDDASRSKKRRRILWNTDERLKRQQAQEDFEITDASFV